MRPARPHSLPEVYLDDLARGLVRCKNAPHRLRGHPHFFRHHLLHLVYEDSGLVEEDLRVRLDGSAYGTSDARVLAHIVLLHSAGVHVRVDVPVNALVQQKVLCNSPPKLVRNRHRGESEGGYGVDGDGAGEKRQKHEDTAMVTRICHARSVGQVGIASREVSRYLQIFMSLCGIRGYRHALLRATGSEAQKSHGISRRLHSAPHGAV